MWEELNKRAAVVFLHGAQVPSSTPRPHAFLGIPITEVRSHAFYRFSEIERESAADAPQQVPNETFKAAAQLVVRESGGLVAFGSVDDPLSSPLDLEPRDPVVAARTPEALAQLAQLPVGRD